MLKYRIPQIVTLTLFLSLSTHLVRLTERKNPDNQSIIRVYWYPDPGSNRDGSESIGV